VYERTVELANDEYQERVRLLRLRREDEDLALQELRLAAERERKDRRAADDAELRHRREEADRALEADRRSTEAHYDGPGGIIAILKKGSEDIRLEYQTRSADLRAAYETDEQTVADLYRNAGKTGILDYAGGFDGDLSDQRAGVTWQEAVLLLKAADPWATDALETVSTYDETDLGDDLTVTNGGHLDAYPAWTITGPASAITVINVTTGKAFALTAGGLALGIGDQLTIDTRPASQRTDLPVLDDTGASQFSKLTATSSLWQFVPGVNHFTIAMAGTSGVTAIVMSYRARYRGLRR
jgi:hypothetical protein